MISIDIVSDTVCPWCFIGKRRLETAIGQRSEYQYQIGWRPFQLNPDLATGGMERKQYLAQKFGNRERARQIYEHVKAAGVAENIPFNFDAIGQQPNTFDSHRLIRWAAEAEIQDAVVEELFRRYFTRGVDIGDRGILIDVADFCGMDGSEVRRQLEDDVDCERVCDEELVARRMGVNGVPCFIIDRKYAVSGAQDPSVLVNVFDLAISEGQEPRQAAEEAVDG